MADSKLHVHIVLNLREKKNVEWFSVLRVLLRLEVISKNAWVSFDFRALGPAEESIACSFFMIIAKKVANPK